MGLRIGIVGAGSMASYHIAGFRSAGAEIVAIADKSSEAAQRAGQTHGVEKTFSSVPRMYRELKGLDAISIITPNVFHYQLVIQGLSRGMHVFCEKPPALNARQVSRMAQIAATTRRMLMFDFNNRARPESYAMMEYIRNGQVGRINSAQATWIRRTGIPGFGGWFTDKKISGGGPVIDLLHMIDLALFFMQYPEPHYVLAQVYHDFIDNKAFKGPWGIPDVKNGVTNVESAAHGLVKFSTGQVLSFRNSWAEMNKREEVSVVFQGQNAGGMVQRLFGVDGIDATSMDTCELYVQEHGRSVNRSILVEPDETMGRIRAARNFVLALEGKEAPLNTPEEAIKLMKIIDAVYASARSGKPVKVR